ncbi:glutathione S-transferase A3-like [Diadema antillarum]|uniref:glutathione S-transferase A3-like n=1 Tax=Diadema antillarum TaxID=105358 RepID=UPI003A871B3C
MADGKPRLTYTPGRGLAEVTRLALVAGGIEYEDIYLTSREAFLQLINDGKLLFNQIPLLEMDGICLVGSDALLRYVCNKAGLMGKTDKDQAMIEMLTLGARDLLKSGLPSFKFSPPEKQEEIIQNIAKQSRERYLPIFEKVKIM